MKSIVFALLFSCVLLSHSTLAKKGHLEECMKKTGITVTPEMLQKLQKAHDEGALSKDTIPDEMLCLPKCVLEERKIIDGSGKISIERLKEDPMMKHVPKQDVFLKCAQNIDKIAKCDDIKKLIHCRVEAN
ncbi:hypothetical protein WA026_016145 [Henosepilachna vigintioctopunctata]|uniref:Uncharacterized protein n=1 Tax=Henosepilachna vigintioctopunctata TaxID=420089 RepID=A0AAW1TU18_9CUCU